MIFFNAEIAQGKFEQFQSAGNDIKCTHKFMFLKNFQNIKS